MKDEVKLSDVYFAAYLRFNGFPVMKCVAYDRTNPVWTFVIPAETLKSLEEDFEKDRAYIDSIKHLQNLSVVTKRHGGEFLCQEYRELLGI